MQAPQNVQAILGDTHDRKALAIPPDQVFRAEAATFYHPLGGYIRAVRTAGDGKQVISLFIPPGELLGLAAALGRVSYPASAIAATEVAALA